MIKKLSLLLFVSVIFFGSASFVLGADVTPPAEPPASGEVIDFGSLMPTSCKDLSCITGQLLGLISTIAMIILPFIVMYGAFQILTAGGDPKKVQTGGKTILYAVIGFIIAFVAKDLTALLLDVVGGGTPPTP